MMRKVLLLGIAVAVLVSFPLMAVSGLAKQSDCENPVYVKHLNMAGGDAARCSECHNGVKADLPGLLKGRYAYMGGPNHGCTDCHDGVKAPLLPLPWGANSCADCHPTK